jgi:hypothetical protein
MVTKIGKAGSGNEADIAGADHGHAHNTLLTSSFVELQKSPLSGVAHRHHDAELAGAAPVPYRFPIATWSIKALDGGWGVIHDQSSFPERCCPQDAASLAVGLVLFDLPSASADCAGSRPSLVRQGAQIAWGHVDHDSSKPWNWFFRQFFNRNRAEVSLHCAINLGKGFAPFCIERDPPPRTTLSLIKIGAQLASRGRFILQGNC